MAILNIPSSSKFNNIVEDLNELYPEGEVTLENFTKYLGDNGYSTAHAEELFAYYQNPNVDNLKLDKHSFKIRKTHPKRDAFIKKGLIPATLTGTAIGGAIGAIAASGLVGGSTVLGFIPVSGTPGLTALATATVGFGAGLIATPAVLIAKRQLGKAYYSAKYKSAKANLKDYESGIELEDLKITQLINKIEQTKQSILSTNEGSKWTALFRSIKKHSLNTINRNRIHHVEAYTKDLAKMYKTISAGKDEDKEVKLQPIAELLLQVNDFLSKDMLDSKINALLTCDNKGKHSHEVTIENVDIYATLDTVLKSISIADASKVEAAIKQGKKSAKNTELKKLTARKLLNNTEDNLVRRILDERYLTADAERKDAEFKEFADAEARRKAEAKARKKAEAERLAKEEAERLAAEEARKKAEAERLAKEEARKRAEEEARKKAEAERLAKEEAKRRAEEEARKKAEADKLAEEERKRKAEEEARKKAEAERLAKEENERKNLLEKTNKELDEIFKISDFYERNSKLIELYLSCAKTCSERGWNETADGFNNKANIIIEQVNAKREQDRIAEQERKAKEAEGKKLAEEARRKAREAIRSQNVNYKTKPIMFNNEMIGTMLQIKTPDSIEKIEIRYMASKKQIRVKTTNSNSPEKVTERLIPITDTIIPPYNQMGDILKEVAKSKHINNVEDLVIEP